MPVDYNPPVVEFLTKEERAKWYADKRQFFVVEAEKTQGTYGPCANYKLLPVDAKGDTSAARYMSFALTDQKSGADIKRRCDELDWFIGVLGEGETVGPLVLDQSPTTKGNPAWAFVGVKN
jgi:hypothetical protein